MPASIGPGNELQVINPATGQKRLLVKVEADYGLTAWLCDTNGRPTVPVMSIDGTSGAVQTAKPGRTVAANGALTIGPEDGNIILLNSSDAATKAATITAPTAVATGGAEFTIVLKARSSTGSYTVACTNAGVSGTVTFDAALESATFQWINGVLNVLTLTGATFA